MNENPPTASGEGSEFSDPHSVGVELTVERLSHAYQTRRGPVSVLKDLSLTIEPGTFVSLIGPSGCGKSTLVRALAGLLKASSGSIRVNGSNLDGPPQTLGMAFQDSVLLDWRTVLDNVLLQADVRRLPRVELEARARQLLASVGLGHLVDRYPYELSGGQKQRVAVCRALVHQPRLLMMDEPFGALDALTRESISEDLQSLWLERRMTTVFVTHSISEAVFLSDRVIVLANGSAGIAADVRVEVPRPRRLFEMPRIQAYTDAVAEIRAILHEAHGSKPVTASGVSDAREKHP